MKVIQNIIIIAIVIAILSFAGCREKDTIQTTKVSLTLLLPDNAKDLNILEDSTRIEFKNVSTAKIFQFKGLGNIILPEGLYDCFLVSKGVCEENKIKTLKAYAQSLSIIGEISEHELKLFETTEVEGFVIEEIFFTGVLTPQGKQYYGCSYFKIKNNTDKLLYADSLAICESQFVSTTNWDYQPDIRSEAMSVCAVYMIPGSGKDVPVQPGETLLIADIAIDHRQANPNGYDLSGADFEWYDDSPNPRIQDIDNPLVPNLEKIYCYTLTIWVPHNRGFRSYGLAKIKVDKETYLRDYIYEYSYTMNLPQGAFPMTSKGYKVPNEWFEDVVNCSVESKYVWNLVDPSLDAGWTYCGKIDHDKTRYNKSVRRKIAYTTRDGREVLLDTNNSTYDFEHEARPSMMPEETNR